jgi:hypothetical protein
VLSSALRAASPRRTHRATGPGCTPFQSISYSVYFHPRRFNSAFHPGTEIRAAVLAWISTEVHRLSESLWQKMTGIKLAQQIFIGENGLNLQ